MVTWTLLLAIAIGAAAPEVEVQTLGGEALRGSVLKLDDEAITLKTADGPVTLQIDKLLSVSGKGAAGTPTTAAMAVELVDGSRLVVKDYTVKEGRAKLVCEGGDLEVPTRDIIAVRLQAADGDTGPQWRGLVQESIDADLLVIRKEQVLDYHKGVLHDVTDKTVQFALEGEILPVKRAKVFGLLYRHPAGRELAAASCGLSDAGGSRWMVRTIGLEGDKLRWTTPTGLTVDRPLSSVTRIDFSEGKVLYLSDLEPESVAWTPFFGTGDKIPLLSEFFAPRKDHGLESKPLRLGKKQYKKGLAVHSRTRLVYRLPGRFRRFAATVGIDEGVRPHGNVRLVVRGDDRILLEKTITGNDAPLPVDLDITGAVRLTILVDFGEDLDVADHLDLCEARIIK